jgi:hypothetical protein
MILAADKLEIWFWQMDKQSSQPLANFRLTTYNTHASVLLQAATSDDRPKSYASQSSRDSWAQTCQRVQLRLDLAHKIHGLILPECHAPDELCIKTTLPQEI